jgi:hypothetical protein
LLCCDVQLCRVRHADAIDRACLGADAALQQRSDRRGVLRQVVRQPRLLRRQLRPLLCARADAACAAHQPRSAPARTLRFETGRLARQAGRLQTGFVYHYAFAMLIGIVALATWYILRTGR